MRIPTLSFVFAALLVAPVASAQFTGLVTPPPRPEPPVELVARAGDVSGDTTAAQQRMTDMKAWVDSAAVAVAAQAPQDTATPPVIVETPPAVVPPQEEVTAFREGTPAPDTATPLPALLLLGAALVAGGVALRRR